MSETLTVGELREALSEYDEKTKTTVTEVVGDDMVDISDPQTPEEAGFWVGFDFPENQLLIDFDSVETILEENDEEALNRMEEDVEELRAIVCP